jgi:DNA-binding NtrC family response regulator
MAWQTTSAPFACAIHGPITSVQSAPSSSDLLLGPSAAIARVWSQIRRVAPHFRTVLITGEPGCGTGAVAHALHRLSPLAERPFVELNAHDCSSRLTGTLDEFSGETLFFPEVERLSAAAQRSLLHLMRHRRPYRIAIIAASATDLRSLVSAGTFSAPLAMQLSSLQLSVPPLRARREDIPALATTLYAHEADGLRTDAPPLSTEFLEALAAEEWPGNIDELQGILRRMLQHVDAIPEPAMIRSLLEDRRAETPPPTAPIRLLRLEQVVQEHIRAVLMRCNGNKLRAAEILGISRSTLYRMLDAQAMGAQLPLAS